MRKLGKPFIVNMPSNTLIKIESRICYGYQHFVIWYRFYNILAFNLAPYIIIFFMHYWIRAQNVEPCLKESIIIIYLKTAAYTVVVRYKNLRVFFCHTYVPRLRKLLFSPTLKSWMAMMLHYAPFTLETRIMIGFCMYEVHKGMQLTLTEVEQFKYVWGFKNDQ